MDDAAPRSAEAHDIVAAMLVREGRVLLCHRCAARRWYPDVWDLPGGHVEGGESPVEALARELEEELGILIQQPGPELVQVVEPGFVLRIWLVDTWDGDPVNASPAEHDDLGWFDASQVADLPLAHSRYLSLIRDTLIRPASLERWQRSVRKWPASTPAYGLAMSEQLLEDAALAYEATAEELELAARHCRTAAQQFREREIPRAAAHAWAAFGHVQVAEDTLQDQARTHARKSNPL